VLQKNPSHWAEVPIVEILKYRDDQVVFDDMAEYITITVKRRHGGLEAREKLFGHEIKTKKQYRLHRGAFIISRVQCWHAAFAIVPDDIPENMIASQNYDQFEISPKVNKRFFWWLSHSPQFIETVRSSASGVVIEKLVFNRDAWLKKTIPVPPLDEQSHIVERVEALADRIAKAQSLREEASEEAGFLHGSFAAKALNDVSGSPKHSIGDICDVRGGIQKQPARLPDANPIPYLTVAHVQRNHIDISSPTRYFEVSPDELPRWKLEIGDLLIIEGNGSADQIGRVALYRGELGTCVHQNHVIRARPNKEIVSSEYLNMYMNSPLGQDEVQKRSRTTSGLRTLSVGRIREIEIPIPPLDEQRRIVAYLDSVQARLASLRELQSATGEELSALLPSVLDRAFKGEL
jgi:type I restriction enzyme S subunit